MPIKLAPLGTRPFDANSGTERFKVRDIRFPTIPSLVRGHVDSRVDQLVMKVYRMK